MSTGENRSRFSDYRITSVLEGKPLPTKRIYRYGDVLSVTMGPKEILLFDFTTDE